MPEGSAVPSVATGWPSLRTALWDRSTATREPQTHAKTPRQEASHVYEGSRVVRRAAWRGMIRDSVRRTREHLARSENPNLTCVQCEKGEFAARINEILYVE
jgi:hypothetical protein